MKISYGDVQLVDTSDGSGSTVSGLHPNIERSIQVVSPIRGAARIVIPRGNKLTQFSFQISRPCGSPAGAVYLAFVQEQQITTGGSLVITPNGSTATITLSGELHTFNPTLIGERLFIDYAFVGGIAVAQGFTNQILTENGVVLTDEAGNRLID
jgi:hypothetical protein